MRAMSDPPISGRGIGSSHDYHASETTRETGCACDCCCFGFSSGNPTSFHILGWGISIGQPCGVVLCCVPIMC